MDSVFTLAISNSVAAGVLALIAIACSGLNKSPQLTHTLWLLVLIKLVTPPIADVPVSELVPWLSSVEASSEDNSTAGATLTAAPENDASKIEAVSQPVPVKEVETSVDSSIVNSVLDAVVTVPIPSEHLPGEKSVQQAETLGSLAPALSVEVDPTQEFTTETAVEIAAFPDELNLDVPAVATEERFLSVPAESTVVTQATEPADQPSPSARVHGAAIGRAIFLLWCLGTVLSLGVLVWRCFRFRRVPRLACDAEDDLQRDARQFANQLGLSHCPQVVVADVCIPPLVWGMSTRPVIVLPRALLNTLDFDQTRAVLMHELVHVRRRDYVVRWIEAGVLALFWWNPLSWWARRQLREAEEECCDAWVVWALPDCRKAYGQALLKTVEFLTESPRVPAVAGTAFGGNPIKRRIEMILDRSVNPTMSRGSVALVLLLAAGVLPLSAQPPVAPIQDPKVVAAEPETSDPVSPTAPRNDSEPINLIQDETSPAAPARPDPVPRDPNTISGFRIPTPAQSGERSSRFTDTKGAANRDSSGRLQNAAEQQLAALARMEERIIRLEKIVQSLAHGQSQMIEQRSIRQGASKSVLEPGNTRTPVRKPTSTTPSSDPGLFDAPVPSPVAPDQNTGTSNRTLSGRIAVSPNGKFVASMTSDTQTTQVDLFDTKTGRPVSRFKTYGQGSSIEFVDDTRLNIRGEKLNHMIAVPTGNLIRQVHPAVPSSALNPVQSAIRNVGQPNSISTEYALLLKQLESMRDAQLEKQKALQRDSRLLALEVELQVTKLAQEKATLEGLTETGTATETDIERQELTVKQASLEVDKAKTILEFKLSEASSVKTATETLDVRIRKMAQDFARKFPTHQESKKYRDLFRSKKDPTPNRTSN